MASIPQIARDLSEIAALDASLVFPSFSSDTAWTLGSLLRSRLLTFDKPCVIDISLAHGAHCLFHSTTGPGTTPDNDVWVVRKRNTVLRFGVSTWYMHNKFAGDEGAFVGKYALEGRRGEFAIHGGGWPVRVAGVEGVVAVIVVSGLKQEEDHGVIVQVVGDYLEELGIEMGIKKKGD